MFWSGKLDAGLCVLTKGDSSNRNRPQEGKQFVQWPVSPTDRKKARQRLWLDPGRTVWTIEQQHKEEWWWLARLLLTVAGWTRSQYMTVAWHNSGRVQGGYVVGTGFYMAGRNIRWVQGGYAVGTGFYMAGRNIRWVQGGCAVSIWLYGCISGWVQCGIRRQYMTVWLYQWAGARWIRSKNMTLLGCTSGWVQEGYLMNTLPCSVWQNSGF
jgi:hypothetical protein